MYEGKEKQGDYSFLEEEEDVYTSNKKLDKLLLLKESLQVPQLQARDNDTEAQGHDTEPSNSGVRFFTHCPHLGFSASMIPVTEKKEEQDSDMSMVCQQNQMKSSGVDTRKS